MSSSWESEGISEGSLRVGRELSRLNAELSIDRDIRLVNGDAVQGSFAHVSRT